MKGVHSCSTEDVGELLAPSALVNERAVELRFAGVRVQPPTLALRVQLDPHVIRYVPHEPARTQETTIENCPNVFRSTSR